MKSKEECIKYFKEEHDNHRREIQKLYLKNKISFYIRDYILTYISIHEKNLGEDLHETASEDSIEGITYLSLLFQNKTIIYLMIILIEIEKLMRVNTIYKKEDISNVDTVKKLAEKLKDPKNVLLNDKDSLDGLSVILGRPINVDDYPIRFFKEKITKMSFYEVKQILDYIEHMGSKEK